MSFRWAEFTGETPRDIAHAWAYMKTDSPMAVGSVFEMKAGQFKVIYSVLGQVVPSCDGPFRSLADAKQHMEFISTQKLLRARVVILDQKFH